MVAVKVFGCQYQLPISRSRSHRVLRHELWTPQSPGSRRGGNHTRLRSFRDPLVVGKPIRFSSSPLFTEQLNPSRFAVFPVATVNEWINPFRLQNFSPKHGGASTEEEQLNIDVSSKDLAPEKSLTAMQLGPKQVYPSITDAINWFCASLIVLVVLIDFTPLGPFLRTTDDAALWLAGIQWLLFVFPTFNFCREAGFKFFPTFSLKRCNPKFIAAGLLGGASLWVLLSAAIALKVGLTAPMSPLIDGAKLFGSLSGPFLTSAAGAAVSSMLSNLVWVGLSPALAEELLFRGFLLSALQDRFGRIDAVMLSALLFAIFHLSLDQLFPNMALGIAAGLAVAASGSVWPAVFLHAAYNITALLYTILIFPSLASTLPPDWLIEGSILGTALAIYLTAPRKLQQNEK